MNASTSANIFSGSTLMFMAAKRVYSSSVPVIWHHAALVIRTIERYSITLVNSKRIRLNILDFSQIAMLTASFGPKVDHLMAVETFD